MQDYWSGLPFPSPADLPDPGIEPRSLTLQADSLPTETQGRPRGPSGENKQADSPCVSLLCQGWLLITDRQEPFITNVWSKRCLGMRKRALSIFRS